MSAWQLIVFRLPGTTGPFHLEVGFMRKKRRMKYRLVRRRAVHAIRVPTFSQLDADAVLSVRALSSAFDSFAQMMRRAAQVMRSFALPSRLVQTSAH